LEHCVVAASATWLDKCSAIIAGRSSRPAFLVSITILLVGWGKYDVKPSLFVRALAFAPPIMM
jgi:hypothetical protein